MVLFVAAMSLSALTGCADKLAGGRSRDGTITGQIYNDGGPLVRGAEACRQRKCPAGGTIAIIDGSHVIAKLWTAADRPVRINLPPTRYTMSAGAGCAVAHVDLKAHEVVAVRIRCYVR